MLGSQAAVDLSQDPTASAVGSAGAAEVAESGRGNGRAQLRALKEGLCDVCNYKP